VLSNNVALKNANDTFSGTVAVSNTSTTAFQVQKAAAGLALIVGDTSNMRVAVNQASAGYTLDVNGDINTSTALRIGGVSVCSSTSCTPSGGSGNYIQNNTVQQSGANFNIKNTNINSIAGVVEAASGQIADILDVQSHLGSTKYLAINSSGQIQLQGANSATTALVLGGDANLYRSAAGVLKTDNSFTVGGTLSVTGNSVFTGTLTVGGNYVITSPAGNTRQIVSGTATFGGCGNGSSCSGTISFSGFTSAPVIVASLMNADHDGFGWHVNVRSVTSTGAIIGVFISNTNDAFTYNGNATVNWIAEGH
ncbi:MAG: hypothetical protein JWO96_56, partial [Candidatus Saccharibacteria bacterium]|nr:hypothetical protein [Candidatus Saccharibacteria bacterium]